MYSVCYNCILGDLLVCIMPIDYDNYQLSKPFYHLAQTISEHYCSGIGSCSIDTFGYIAVRAWHTKISRLHAYATPSPNRLPFTLTHTIGPIHYWNSDQKLDVLGRQYHDIIYTRVITEHSMPMHIAVTGYIGFIQRSAIAMWPLSCSITAECPVTPLTPGLRAARHILTAAVKCRRRFRPLPH